MSRKKHASQEEEAATVKIEVSITLTGDGDVLQVSSTSA